MRGEETGALVDGARGIVRTVIDWVKTQDNIRALASLDAHARNAARTDSDVDLVFLARNPNEFRDIEWLLGIDWLRAGVRLIRWGDAEHGALWCRRAWFEPECEVEFAFAFTAWADVSSMDKQTMRVVSDGCHILYDPDQLLERLTLAVTRHNLQPSSWLPFRSRLQKKDCHSRRC